MQHKYYEIQANNVSLLAISPMLKNITVSLVKKLGLEYPVLSDIGNNISNQYGLVFTLADSLQPIYKGFGINLEKANGDDSLKLPLPATYIIDSDRIIKFRFVDVDHTTRLDPDIMMTELNKIL